MAVQTDNLLIRPTVSPYVPRSLDPDVDSLALSVDIELLNGHSMIIDGNLTVRGTTTTVESEVLKVADNHVYLNDGYTTAAAETGGLVVNYLPTATTDTVAATGFTAGVPATSNPTVNTTAATTFSVGDLVQFSGTANSANSGLFEVLSHAANLLTVRGIGTVANVEDFTQNDFVTDTTVQGTITLVNVSVLRSGIDGTWEVASGSTTGFSFDNLVTAATAASTLQDAYENGNTITTSGAEGLFIVNGDQSLQIGGTVLLDVNTQADFDVSQFDVDVTGAGYSLDADTASNVTVTGGVLTLSTVTSGSIIINGSQDIDIDAAQGIAIDAGLTSNLTMAANDAGLQTLTIAATNAGAGEADLIIAVDRTIDVDADALDIDLTGAFTLDALSASIDATASSNFTVTGGVLSLTTLTSGGIIINSVDSVDIDGSSFTIDGTLDSNVSVVANEAGVQTLAITASNAGVGDADILISPENTLDVNAENFEIDATLSSNLTMAANDAGLQTLTIAATNAGAGDGRLLINVDDTFDANATAFDFDATAQSVFTVTGAALIHQTLTSGDIRLLSVGNVDIDGVVIDLAATSGVLVSAAANSNFTVAGANLTLNTTTSGEIAINAADVLDLDSGTATAITSGTTMTLISNGNGTFSVSGATLTLQTTTSGNVDINSAGAVLVDAVAQISLDAATASNFTVVGADLALEATGVGNLTFLSGAASTFELGGGIADAFTMQSGADQYLLVDTVDDELELPSFTNISGGEGIQLTADAVIAIGEIVQIISAGGGSGRVDLADADTGSLTDANVVGVAAEAGSAGNPMQTFTVPGSLIPVLFGAAPAAANNGDAVYLSTVAGQATLTAPTGNDEVTFRIGYLQGADGADTTPLVLYQPQFLSAGPQVT
jgi:frataxin-like iron-binding protein CyaY